MIVQPDRRTRAVGVVVAALAAVATAVLIYSFNGQTPQPSPYADGADPTTPVIETSVGAPPTTSGGRLPDGEPPRPYPSMDGTRTIWITPPPGQPMNTDGPPPVTTTNPGPPPPPPPTSTSTRTFTVEGNSAVADCVNGNQAHLISWTPAPGYKLTPPPRPGPGTTARIWFRMQSDVIMMVISCVDGTPQASINPPPPPPPPPPH